MDGVEFYLHRGLMLSAPKLTVRLGGIWRWRWLKVDGVAPLAASCAV